MRDIVRLATPTRETLVDITDQVGEIVPRGGVIVDRGYGRGPTWRYAAIAVCR